VTPRQKQLLHTSFKDLRTQAAATTNLFYGHLFEINPRLEKLFVDQLRHQEPSLMQTIAIAVRGLDHLDEMAASAARTRRALCRLWR
jgi:hemoglobin-like flavoprotein